MRGPTGQPERAARALRRAWPGVVNGDVDAVHRARVATRRLREAVPLLDAGRRHGGRRLRRDLRALTRALGPIRELDVTIGLVVRLLHDEPALDGALELVRQDLMERRARRRASLRRDFDEHDIAAITARITALADRVRQDETPDPSALGEYLQARIARRVGRLVRAVAKAGALYAPGPLHDARIATKKLRYATELAAAAGLPGVAGEARRLERFQDLLGELHDWQVLGDHVGRLQAATPLDDDRMADLTVLLAHVEDRCRALHARFVARRDALLGICSRLGAAGSRDGARASRR